MNKFIAVITVILGFYSVGFAEEMSCKKLAEDFAWGLRVASPDRVKKALNKSAYEQPYGLEMAKGIVSEVADHGHFEAKDSKPSAIVSEGSKAEDFATGIDKDGEVWTITAVTSERCRFFLVYSSKEQSKLKPEIVAVWELVARQFANE